MPIGRQKIATIDSADCRAPVARYAALVGDFVRLRCDAEALIALATGLRRFGPPEGAPEWLVSGVWLCTEGADYLATPSVEVLGNGYVARPLNIHRPADLVREVKAHLSDVSARLVGRNSDLRLASCDEMLAPPGLLKSWPDDPYSMRVLLRASRRHSKLNEVACALLMESETKSLLVGTDPSTMAMVLSEDLALIERYCGGCEALTVDGYLARAGC
jgi:hypothetical protein